MQTERDGWTMQSNMEDGEQFDLYAKAANRNMEDYETEVGLLWTKKTRRKQWQEGTMKVA